MFLLYMSMAAIYITWSEPFEWTFIPPTHKDSIWNLASIGPAASQQMFKSINLTLDLVVLKYIHEVTLSNIYTNFQIIDFTDFYKI